MSVRVYVYVHVVYAICIMYSGLLRRSIDPFKSIAPTHILLCQLSSLFSPSFGGTHSGVRRVAGVATGTLKLAGIVVVGGALACVAVPVVAGGAVLLGTCIGLPYLAVTHISARRRLRRNRRRNRPRGRRPIQKSLE